MRVEMSAFQVLNLFQIFAVVDQVVFEHMEKFLLQKVSAFPDSTLETERHSQFHILSQNAT